MDYQAVNKVIKNCLIFVYFNKCNTFELSPVFHFVFSEFYDEQQITECV